MARCGCQGLTTCNCGISSTGGVGVEPTSEGYNLTGPYLVAVDTPSYDVDISGNGSAASPWRVTVKLRIYTTVGRPSAVTAGDGAPIYDSTLNKPVWSDGAVWRDATGTAV